MSIALYLHGEGHNIGTTSETGHRQDALQRHGIWWCPCLENKPPTSNGIFCTQNLGTCVMVLSRYISVSPTIFTKLQHAVATAATSTHLGFLNQSQPDPMDHANGSPQGNHLHWPWQWAGTSHTGTCCVCTWYHPIEGQVYPTLCSRKMWLRSYLDLDTLYRHSPDQWFTRHQLVILPFHLSTSTCWPIHWP